MKARNWQLFWILPIATALAAAAPLSEDAVQSEIVQVPEGQLLKLEGVVVERSEQSMLVRRTDGDQVLVSWDGSTKIREKKSNIFRGAKQYSPQDLLLGLTLTVEGRGDASGRLQAAEIKFTQDDLDTARTIASSLEPMEHQLDHAKGEISRVEKRLAESDARNELAKEQLSGEIEDTNEGLRKTRDDLRATQESAQQALDGVDKTNHRISALDDYEVARTLTVHFQVNSDKLSDEAALTLEEFAQAVQQEKGYLIEVVGHASADGDAEFNRRLSERRADSVRRYLAEAGGISLRRFITPYGMGENRPAADDSTREGRRENRRVEVRLLVNNGLTETRQMTANTSGSN